MSQCEQGTLVAGQSSDTYLGSESGMAGVRDFTELRIWRQARQWSKDIFWRTQEGQFARDQRLMAQINDSSESVAGSRTMSLPVFTQAYINAMRRWFCIEARRRISCGMYLSLCVVTVSASAAAAEPAIYFPVADSEGGWRKVTGPEEVGRLAAMDAKKLDEAFEYVQTSTKNGGLLVVRRGWLVYERYFGKGHQEATCNLASCGKSVTSVAVGILLSERADLFPEGLEQRVFTPKLMPPEAFPLSDPRKAEIKLGQMLAMTAGIRGNNPVWVRGQSSTINPPGPDGSTAMRDAIALGLEERASGDTTLTTKTLWCEPGEGYSYATSSIHLASIMLRRVTGQELETYVAEHLAKPLGWERWGFGYKTARLGHTPGGGGVVLRPSDMLRFGYLLLREGRWNEQQVVLADYVRHCARRSPYNPHFPYSLQFDVNSAGDYPELPKDAFWKSGSGGHAIYVVPSLDLVVWKLGGRDNQYSPADTGIPIHPDAEKSAQARDDWKETVGADTALRKTLELVVAAAK